MIRYTENKEFTREQIQQLFSSVGWVSANYPNRLYKALMGSATVISAWDEDKLVGLVRIIDDTEMVAFMHWVLVNPSHQGRGIAGHMVELALEKYNNYLYVEIMPEKSSNAPFYEKYGFKRLEDGVAMQVCHY